MNDTSEQEQPDIALLAAGASISLIGKVGGRGIVALTQILIARQLGPDLYGLYAIGWTLLIMIELIASLGLDKGVLRFATPQWQRNDGQAQTIIERSIRLVMISGVLVAVFTFLLSPVIADAFRKPELMLVIRWFSLAIPFATGGRVIAAATRVTKRVNYEVYSRDLGQPILQLFLVLASVGLGWGLVGALAATTISYILSFLIALYFLRRLVPRRPTGYESPEPRYRQLIIYSMPTSIASTFTVFIAWVSRLFVGFLLPAAAAGIYQAVSQVSLIFAIILGAFNAIITPMISELHENHATRRLEEVYRVSTKWGIYLSFPAFIVILVFPRDIMNVIFGPDFVEGWVPLIILAIGQFINVATGAVGLLLMMSDNQNRWFLISGIMFGIGIVANLILILLYGLIGAAIATTLTLSVMYLWGLQQVHAHLHIWPYDWRYTKGILAGVVSVVVVVSMQALDIRMGFFGLATVTSLAYLAFGTVLFLLKFDEEELQFVRVTRRGISRRVGFREP